MLIFSTKAYNYMREDLLRRSNPLSTTKMNEGEVEHITFPDGERYQRVISKVEGEDVVLIGGTVSDKDTLEIYDLAGTLVEQGARSLTLICPYFGYSTMERATKAGEVVTAKSRARMFSSLPIARLGNRIILFDLHTEGLPYYFEGALRPFHLYGKTLVAKAVKELKGEVLACTDAGRAKWVESLANDLNIPASFVFKRRLSGDKTEVSAVSAQVDGKDIVIYDDMIRTGGSLIGAAQAYKDAGAKSISVVTTHGIFPDLSASRLYSSKLFKQVVCTDSHPRVLELAGPGLEWLKVIPIAPLLNEFLASHLVAG